LSRNAVVIVAAGRGSRIGDSGGPKQYRLLAGKSLLQHTIEAFTTHDDIDLVQVVIHADDGDIYRQSVIPDSKLREAVYGGASRQASCKAGIDALKDTQCEKVLIHDAARPFVSHDTISNVLGMIAPGLCALPARAVADTVKRASSENAVTETVSRNGLFLAQTPQGFLHDEITEAHDRASAQSDREFTDDAAVAEWAGMKVRLVEGNRENFKITNSDDLREAERMLSPRQVPDVRTGNGYDVHTLGPGDHVMLCGVRIEHHQSLQGHSDADVGLHSLTDALLGTISGGDIGSHFPPSDPQWKGVSSDRFISHAAKLVRDQGGVITNLDVTIICETPKIGPHRDAMRERIGEICNIDPSRISVKATTNEKIGFVGRGEGIASIATATVVFT
jgi:2-C-methyl-D-erythritol 4-phosphate cytidylyltransferase/2-C-methyl-D-erythritol 2,4-cyclodiphosphate synthase